MDKYINSTECTNAKWQNLNNTYQQILAELREKGKELRECHSQLKLREKALAENNGGKDAKGEDKLKLNVGGTRVTVRRETLTQLKGTKLAALFSGRWENRLLRDSKNRIFLDVNPSCFKKIVHFHTLLKTANPEDPPNLPEVSPEEKNTFDRLCDFFGITEAIAPSSPACMEIESLIIEDTAHLKAMKGWLKDVDGEQAKLIYRASRDGWESQNFHTKCDNQGPTLTVIKSTGGYIFGGYLDAPWTSTNTVIRSDRAFLYALHCHAGLPPTKMGRGGESSRRGYEGCGYAKYGPIFGGGNDIHVASNSNVNESSYTNVGKCYNCPPGVTYEEDGQTFLTGARNFKAAEVEVFSVSAWKDPRVKKKRRLKDDISADLDGLENSVGGDFHLHGFCRDLCKALESELHALNDAKANLEHLEKQLASEEAFVNFFASGDTKDIVMLDVSGEKMSAKRSTLVICKDSVLARQFDDVTWPQQQDQTSGSDSEDEGILIESCAYCFGKIIDQLRLHAITKTGDKLPPPLSIVEHEKKNFARVVSFYFPGMEEFIITAPEIDS